ncbi:MAG TPA: transporter substrate-binding domain-containing protein, partial [Candidatus Cloacimonadota bacterium]|nr:transporter substrate-binding domain-containing protein [Candidatus Cloacimonadota bacterium]
MSEYMIKKIQNISIVLSSFVIIIFAFYGLGARKQIKVELTQEEINWLNDNQDKLTLWYNAEFPPIEFASEKGVFIGMGADVIKRVEEITEITFTKKPSLDWNDHLNALKSGECAVAPTIVRTQDREDYIIFTQPYATVPVVLITTTGNEANLSLKDFNGKRIGVVSGYATEKYLRDQALVYNYDVVSFFNVQEAINSVSFGQIDAFAENLAVAAYFIEKEGIPNLKVAGKTDYFFSFSIGISKKYPILYNVVQKALKSIPEQELTDIRRQWIRLDQEKGMSERTWLILNLTGMFLIILVLALVLLSLLLKRRLNQRMLSLKESEEKYRRLAENMSDMAWTIDLNMNTTYVSPSVMRIFGFTVEEYLKRPITSNYSPESLKLIYEAVAENIELEKDPTIDKQRSRILEVQQYNNQNELIWVSLSATFMRNDKGEPIGLQGITRNINELKLAEQEQKRLSEQLLQAQKMESVGRLAGGVAHDFNNMLGVIIGFSDLALVKIKQDDPIYYNLTEIRKAAERSSNLTRQLLAFARKQTIEPKILDLNETIEGMLKMLIRIIGEDIDLEWLPSKDVWPVKLDPSQIDQILANLCVNSRDAIKGNGKITIETSNAVFTEKSVYENPDVRAGQFIRLSVSDTGSGISKELLPHIFEPFFTTKENGKGTGLGLATIYGAVRQNNGFINVYSEEGRGTSFHIYLPRFVVEKQFEPEPEVEFKLVGGAETILLVEDEASILNMGVMMLESLGYTVLSASNPYDAIKLASEKKYEIDLLLTDVIMPDMNGKEIVGKLQS